MVQEETIRKPKISACIIAYKHEKFIRKCIEGALNQDLDCDYEIIIGEDKSPDNTLEICREYQQKHPELIKLVERDENLGMMGNWLETLRTCNGEYIAICEGDDYWIDKSKLQKQISFLDKHRKYSMCATKTRRLNEKGEFGENTGKKYGKIKLDDVLWQNQFGTCTVVLRRIHLDFPPFENYYKFFGPDWQMWCSLLKKGSGYNMKDSTAIYHVHSEGASSGRDKINILRNKLEDRMLMIENFPDKKKIIKNYGLKIIFHYTWKSLRGHKSYFRALLENKNLIKSYLFY